MYGNNLRIANRIYWFSMPLISALVFMVNSGVCFACSTPVSWTACDCEAPTYTLTVNTNGHGTVSKSPDQPTYSRGEVVTVAFSPNADRVFLRWLCTPNSHTASGSESDAVRVFMTGNTTLAPVTVAKTYTLSINWNKTRGTVALPSGGTMGDGSLTAPITYDSTVNLTATPNSGYYTVWVGQYPDDWSGIRYGNSVSFKVMSNKQLTASFKPNSEYPSTMYDLTVNKTGGSAQIFSAGATSASFSAGSYPYTTATGPSNFSFAVLPLSGYALKYLSWMQGGQTRYVTSDGMTYVPANTYTAYLSKKIKLEVETEGRGVVTSPNFTSSWNAQPYNSQGLTNPPATTITPNVDANEVVMTPSPCSAWAFDHWEYKDASGVWTKRDNPNPGTPQTFKVYMNWWTGSGYHVPNGKETFSVKAIFIGCECGYPDKCSGCLGFSTEGENKYVPICKTDNATTTYNCIAWSVGLTDVWINDVGQPGPGVESIDWNYGDKNGSATIEEWDNFYASHGYARSAGRSGARVGLVTGGSYHGYKIDGCGGDWESKIGPGVRVTHGETWLVTFASYGEPQYYYN